MNRLIILVLLHFMFFHVRAQPSFAPDDSTSQNFQPSVGIVIAILSVMFSVTLLLLVYAKFCHRPGHAHGDLPQNFAFIRSSSRFSGIDKTVIESLPFFRFSSLKGSKEGLECAVCLSKFEDIEMLRLLPKCKHAFHIACIDNWLEKHASCPICRHRVSAEDPTIFTYTHSMRLMNQSELQGEEANVGLFVQREEEEEDHHHHRGSSRFSIGSSFRKAEKGNNKEEMSLIQEEAAEQKALHKHKHKIVVSDFVFKNRWSSVSSSDLMFLNSEMLTSVSSNRFSCLDSNTQQSSSSGAAENAQIVKIKEEMEMKRSFESKVSALNKTSPVSFPDLPSTSSYMSPGERRSMSEITALSRYEDSGMQNRIRETSLLGNNVKEERLRRLWLPIAKRTVQWYANRDRRSQQPQKTQQTLDV
jgi:E3 ubiquitin-protein ligase ATL6/9/15/31/42/55